MLPVLLAVLGLHATAHALDARRGPPGGVPPALGMREPPRLVQNASADQVIAEVERRYRARVVRVESAVVNGRRVYVLRLLSEDGRVWRVRVDADTGREM